MVGPGGILTCRTAENQLQERNAHEFASRKSTCTRREQSTMRARGLSPAQLFMRKTPNGARPIQAVIVAHPSNRPGQIRLLASAT
jgi:hypothetical protein